MNYAGKSSEKEDFPFFITKTCKMSSYLYTPTDFSFQIKREYFSCELWLKI